MNGITICTICMDPIGQNNYCKLKCNHYFCLPCIFSQYTYKNQCPVCRNQILKNKIKFVEKHFHNNQLPPTAPPSPPLPPPFPTILQPSTPPPSYNSLHHAADNLVNSLIEQVNNLSDNLAALELQQNLNHSK